MTVLPYGGADPTSGHAGSSTSRDRALRNDSNGTTAHTQADVLAHLGRRQSVGSTWREAAEELDLHHGAVSAALSVLHKEGHICRLSLVRSRSKVYVLPEWVLGRTTEAQGRTGHRLLMDDMASMIRRLRDTGLMPSEQSMNELLERHNKTVR